MMDAPKGISCIMLATGRIDSIQESLASFLGQNYMGQHEIIVANVCFRQELVFAHPQVTIGNAKQMTMPMQARNQAIAAAKYDIIVLWDEHGFYLPGFLDQISQEMEGRHWCFLEKEYVFDGNKFMIEQGSEFCFAFTKEAWRNCGQFGPGIASPSARNLIGNITRKYPDRNTSVSPSHINIVRIGTADQRERSVPNIKSGKIDLIPNARMDYGMKLGQSRSGNQGKEICVVELGRYGDIIAILPFLKLIHENYKTPHLMVSSEFASLLEGVSYCKVVSVPLKNEQLGMAMAMANKTFEIVIRAQIWGHGHTQTRLCESYNLESFREIGLLHRFYDNTLIPCFDQRDSQRESELKKSVFKTDKKKILVNVSKGVSSPCPHCQKLLSEIQSLWGNDYEVVDLSQVHAHRIYDLLALYEDAACLVSIDTSHLHLVSATNCPVVAITNPKPWAGTVVRFNCVCAIDYDAVKDHPEQVQEAIAAALERENKPIVAKPIKTPTPGRVIHLVDRFDDKDPKAATRKMAAFESWDRLYQNGELVPVHVWDYPRRSGKEIEDTRDLPFVRDLFKAALEQSKPGDFILWNNDDNLLHPEIAERVRFMCSVYGPTSFLRNELTSAPSSLDMRPEEFARLGRNKHIGRDGFAFSHEHLKLLVEDMPDWILGAKCWDIQLALMIRYYYKIKTATSADVAEQIFPAEAPRGLIGHIAHASTWAQGNMEKIPSNIHNGALFKYFMNQACPHLKCTPEGNLG